MLSIDKAKEIVKINGAIRDICNKSNIQVSSTEPLFKIDTNGKFELIKPINVSPELIGIKSQFIPSKELTYTLKNNTPNGENQGKRFYVGKDKDNEFSIYRGHLLTSKEMDEQIRTREIDRQLEAVNI